MDDVVITPTAQASMILSSLASSRLQLGRDIALTGESSQFWSMRLYYQALGVKTALSEHIMRILSDEAVAVSLTHASILDRVSSTIESPEIPVYTSVSSEPDSLVDRQTGDDHI